jgi:hypothetical protein
MGYIYESTTYRAVVVEDHRDSKDTCRLSTGSITVLKRDGQWIDEHTSSSK